MTDERKVCPECGSEMGPSHDRQIFEDLSGDWVRVRDCPKCGHEEIIEYGSGQEEKVGGEKQ
jgi:predicted RNA-binding Zn-ribbon protein involved in translation (DUF1610 family)